MTKRKPVEELQRAPQYDLTPKKRRVPSTRKETQAAGLALVKAQGIDPSDSSTYSPDRPLTEKARLFVKEWASGETILSAAHRAGYSDGGSMAYKLAKDPAVLKLYNEEKRLYQEASQITRKNVIDGMLEGIEMAKLLGEPATIIGGWREVGKMLGYYAEQKKTVNINVKGDVTMQHLNQMSDADLLKLVKGEVTDVAFTEVLEENDGR